MSNDTPKWDDTVPTWDDTEEVSSAPDLSTTLTGGLSPAALREKMLAKGKDNSIDFKAMGMGTAQGALFDFADEIGGGLAAVPALVTPGESSGDAYTKYRDIIRAKDEALKAESPYSYGTGQVIGAIAPAVATMGGSAAATGASAAKGAAELGMWAAAKEAAKRTAVATGKGIALGGASGGLSGLGQSKELTMEDAGEKTLEGALSGAAVGGALGGGATLIGETAGLGSKYVKDTVADSPRLRQLARSFDEGFEGTKFGTGTQSRSEMAATKTADATDITSRLVSEEKRLGADIGTLLTNADDAGIRVQLDEPLSQSAKQITAMIKNDPNIANNPAYDKILKNIFELERGNLSPKVAQQTIADMYSLARKVNPLLSDIPKSFADDLALALDNQVSGLREAKNAFKNYRAAVPETIINKGIPNQLDDIFEEELAHRLPGKMYGKVSDKEAKLFKDVEKLIEEISQPSGSKAVADQTVNALKDRLTVLEQTSPGTVKRLGFESVDDLIRDLRSKGDIESIRQTVTKSGLVDNASAGGLLSNVAATAMGKSVQGANMAGRMAGTTAKVAAPIGRMSKAIFNAPDSTLRGIGAKLTQDPKLAPMGNLLLKALDNKAGIGKNAALFSIMQNPDARKFVDMNFETPEDQE